MSQNTNSDLKQVLNTRDVLMVAFGAMIGWGWVVSSGQWIEAGGVLGTVIGFVIGGIMIYLVGLTYAELTTAMPKAGGGQNFSYAAFGAKSSFICTWTLILSYIGVVCFEACSFATIMQYIIPDFLQGYLYTVAGYDVYLSWVAVAIIASVLITYINFLGTKSSARLQNILTSIIAGVGLLLVAGSAYIGDMNNFSSQEFVGDSTGAMIANILKVAIMTPFFLFGFDVIPQAAEEINVPLKRLGRLMIASIGMAVVFYAMVVVAIGYVMSPTQISQSMGDTGMVTADAIAIAFSNVAMTKVLIIGGLCGIVTTWNSFLMGGSRVLYSMARARMIPGRFSKLHKKYNTPYKALFFLGLLSIIAPLFGRVMLIWIVDAANFACCLAYCIVAMSFVKLRISRPEMERPFYVSNGKFTGVLASIMAGFMAVMYVIPGTNCSFVWQEWVIVGGWSLMGVLMAYQAVKYYGNDFCSGMENL
ncbi:APC family permease [Bacteroides pyogenes]|uniref:APC family permease n=1 Tax=Bacteroides pyogenes TaxID=310300 RepID=A0A5D3FMI0_9BACE|nr:APC family permease [Bacteroides pyogenes]TYK32209.1 APC family permease [Bacteroides pyogenes]TYK49997.1 APC family permease [Bacteroides pyogenes]